MDKKKIFKKIILVILLVVCLFLFVCLIIPQKKASADTYDRDKYYSFDNDYCLGQNYCNGVYFNFAGKNDMTRYGLGNGGDNEIFIKLYDENNNEFHLLYSCFTDFFTDCSLTLHPTSYTDNFPIDKILKIATDHSLVQYLYFGVKLRYGSHDLIDFQNSVITDNNVFRGLNVIFQNSIDNLYNSGLNAGYDSGYSDGYDCGLNAGYNSGYSGGYDSGLNDGYNSGYSGGYDSGLAANVDSAMRDTLATWDGFIPSLFGSVAAFINSTLGNITLFGIPAITLIITIISMCILIAIFKIFKG